MYVCFELINSTVYVYNYCVYNITIGVGFASVKQMVRNIMSPLPTLVTVTVYVLSTFVIWMILPDEKLLKININAATIATNQLNKCLVLHVSLHFYESHSCEQAIKLVGMIH